MWSVPGLSNKAKAPYKVVDDCSKSPLFSWLSPLVYVPSGISFVVGEVTYVELLMDAEGKSRVSL